MPQSIFVYDPTQKDALSRVRGVGRYLQILKENFSSWNYINKLEIKNLKLEIFINTFYNFLQPPLILKRVAKKQIAVIHDLIPLKYPDHFPAGIRGKINIFLNKYALKNYDLIITDSEASKKDIVRMLNIHPDRVRVVYPCLPKLFVNSKSQIPNPKKSGAWNLEFGNYCVYVGDATWNKNLVNLAKAIKIINVTCVFIGKVFQEAIGVPNQGSRQRAEFFQPAAGSSTGGKDEGQNLSPKNPWQQELSQFLQETKNDRRFIFLGFVEDYRLLKFYQQAKLNILPSRDEGFGFSYVEAASQKCPSVLADIPVLHELAKDSAFFADLGNPNELADAIGELYFKKDVRENYAQKALARSQFFSAKKFKKDFLEALNL